MSERKRWPGWVYDEGQEPDYRFSFANERTYLAWIRTSLALAALGLVSALAAWFRWAMAERAIRRSEPLPTFGLGALLALVLVALAAVLVGVLLGELL